jgi:hypothetical protein
MFVPSPIKTTRSVISLNQALRGLVQRFDDAAGERTHTNRAVDAAAR